MRSDFLCETCNRGIWHKTKIAVTVAHGTIIELMSVCILKCPKCSREYILDTASPAKMFAVRSPEALRLIEEAIQEEWFDKIKESVDAVRASRAARAAGEPGCVDGTGSYAGLVGREWTAAEAAHVTAGRAANVKFKSPPHKPSGPEQAAL